ncbi:MAG: RIP metalloprotease RseP [Heliobacteriaceae bacterium]|jgi:regulator of sigma E protease|nr:RIP metalloprotease RseP [Heliobacteriaceae bacterium]
MSIIIMILLLSVLILVHELGHFAAARIFGIKVDKFGFGLPIGPTLWQKKFGDTTYLVHAFLLGGYVSFPDDDENSELPKNSPERFQNKPIWQKMIVISSGVIANIICAFVFVILTAALWHNLPSGKYDVYIQDIIAPKNEAVWESGLKAGDKIYEINGSRIDTKYALFLYSQLNKKFDGKVNGKFAEDNYARLKAVNHAFPRDEIISKDLTVRLPELRDEPAVKLSRNTLKGIEMPKENELALSQRQIALRDEIQGKRYLISDGTITLNDVAYAMSDGAKPLFIKVWRSGEIIGLKTIYPNKEGIIGVMMDIKEILIPVKGPAAIVKNSVKYLYNETYSMLAVLKQLFTGKIPLKNLHGIILITKIGGDIISQDGIFYGLLLTAMISMNLAIINFLPFPALDGGHFMFLMIEQVTGKTLNEKTINLVSNIGFTLLILLMIVVLFNDIFVLVTQK